MAFSKCFNAWGLLGASWGLQGLPEAILVNTEQTKRPNQVLKGLIKPLKALKRISTN